jgi:hypothetical protein
MKQLSPRAASRKNVWALPFLVDRKSGRAITEQDFSTFPDPMAPKGLERMGYRHG